METNCMHDKRENWPGPGPEGPVGMNLKCWLGKHEWGEEIKVRDKDSNLPERRKRCKNYLVILTED